MIEGRWNAAAFTRQIMVTLRRKRSAGADRASMSHWRRADLLWPDFAPRYKD